MHLIRICAILEIYVVNINTEINSHQWGFQWRNPLGPNNNLYWAYFWYRFGSIIKCLLSLESIQMRIEKMLLYFYCAMLAFVLIWLSFQLLNFTFVIFPFYIYLLFRLNKHVYYSYGRARISCINHHFKWSEKQQTNKPTNQQTNQFVIQHFKCTAQNIWVNS